MENKLKILVATGIYPPAIGGPATTVFKLVKELQRSGGFEVKVITYSKEGARSDGAVWRVKQKNHLGYFWRMWRLARWADIIYVTDTYSVGHFAYLIKKLAGKKYILRFAGDSAWEIAAGSGWTADYIIDFIDKTYADPRIEAIKARRRRIIINADRIIAVSNFIGEVAEKIGAQKERITVIPNAVDFQAQNIDPEKVRRIREKYGADGARILVTGGRLTPWKGQKMLIKILRKLQEKTGQKIKLLVLGEGSELERLKKLAREMELEEAVIFLGGVEQSRMINYFKAADAFVLNTNYEAMSHMIMEAMEAGTPVITSDIGGNRELIENGKTGLLAGYNDRQGFLSAAVKVLTDTEFAGKLAAAAKAEMKNFNWEDSFAKTIETIKETAR